MFVGILTDFTGKDPASLRVTPMSRLAIALSIAAVASGSPLLDRMSWTGPQPGPGDHRLMMRSWRRTACPPSTVCTSPTVSPPPTVSSRANGLSSANGLSPTTGLITTADGRKTIEYLVRCALPAGHKITKTYSGVTYTFAGGIGLAPEWETGACGTACQEWVSACMMAHVNTTGQHIGLWMVGNSPALGWGYTSGLSVPGGLVLREHLRQPAGGELLQRHRLQLGRRSRPPRRAADRLAVQESLLGRRVLQRPTASASPATPTGTRMGNADVPDGYTKCGTRTRVVTVYRDFDAVTDYKICNHQSGLCLDVAGNSTTEGAAFDQIAYVSQPRDKFRIVKVGGFDYSFKVQSTGKMVSFPSTTHARHDPGVGEAAGGGEHRRVPGLVHQPDGDRLLPHLLRQTFQCLSVGSNTSGALVQGRPSAGSGAAYGVEHHPRELAALARCASAGLFLPTALCALRRSAALERGVFAGTVDARARDGAEAAAEIGRQVRIAEPGHLARCRPSQGSPVASAFAPTAFIRL